MLHAVNSPATLHMSMLFTKMPLKQSLSTQLQIIDVREPLAVKIQCVFQTNAIMQAALHPSKKSQNAHLSHRFYSLMKHLRKQLRAHPHPAAMKFYAKPMLHAYQTNVSMLSADHNNSLIQNATILKITKYLVMQLNKSQLNQLLTDVKIPYALSTTNAKVDTAAQKTNAMHFPNEGLFAFRNLAMAVVAAATRD